MLVLHYNDSSTAAPPGTYQKRMQKLTVPSSLTELAYKSIRDSILRGDIAAGDRFTEGDLSRRLGISKSPVREALARVEAEGLIEIEPRRGATVREFKRSEIRDLYDLRTALEVHAIRRAKVTPALLARLRRHADEMVRFQHRGDKAAYLREDIAFHAAIARASGNRLLAKDLERVENQIILCRHKSYDLMVSTASDAHAPIIHALEASTKAAAVRAIRKHIADACRNLLTAQGVTQGFGAPASA
jgi:DNA-binding GntR family transcriptional regulator